MPREETVARVREAIHRGFECADDGPPTNQQLIAEAGVAPATFYRVLSQHHDVALLLEGARRGHQLGTSSDGQELSQVVAELREVIAALVHDNRALRRQLAATERSEA